MLSARGASRRKVDYGGLRGMGRAEICPFWGPCLVSLVPLCPPTVHSLTDQAPPTPQHALPSSLPSRRSRFGPFIHHSSTSRLQPFPISCMLTMHLSITLPSQPIVSFFPINRGILILGHCPFAAAVRQDKGSRHIRGPNNLAEASPLWLCHRTYVVVLPSRLSASEDS